MLGAVDLPHRPRRAVNAVSRISRGCTPANAKELTLGVARDNLWYKDAVIYQLHVRTFFDSNGDDVGVIIELVLNHTSDQHPWFQEARSSRDNPWRDWYVWSDTRPHPLAHTQPLIERQPKPMLS
jgi:Alpha amylase, catalytic domain